MLILLASLAGAAEISLSLDDVVQRAWEGHVALELQRAEVATSEASVRPLKRPGDPQLRVRADDVFSNTETVNWRFQLRQPIDPLGSVRARVRAARAEADSDRIALDVLRSEIRADVAESFDLARVLQDAESVGRDVVDAVDQRIGILEKRVEGGVETPDALLGARLDRVAAVRRWSDIRRQLEMVRGELAVLAGVATDDTLVLTGPEPETLLEGVWGGVSAPVQLASAELEALRAERSMVAAERRPSLDWVQLQTDVEAGSTPGFAVTVAGRLPVFSATDGGLAAVDVEVAGMERVRDAEQAAFERSQDIARAQLAASVASYTELRNAVSSSEDALEASRETLRPDVFWDLRAKLLREKLEVYERLAEAVVVRRRSERQVMASP